MIFVDTNVFMYAIGKPHPNRPVAQKFFTSAREIGRQLYTSSEVVQELLHIYHRRWDLGRFDEALALVEVTVLEIWPTEAADVRLARLLADEYPSLDARDLVHLATCRRRGAASIETFDATLRGVIPRKS